jgi:methyltransferase (TIGR00027 family)
VADDPAVVRNVSDTALWAAYFRAEETRRQDALFRDPYAEKLGAARGAEIARNLPDGQNYAWAWVMRTYLFDQFLEQEIAAGADLVVNCAAGLDARPYRLNLPASLQWVEADLPAMIAYKEEKLAGETPRCRLERFPVNLADAAERARFFGVIADRGKRGVVLTEGLLIYLLTEDVGRFARDLSGVASLQRWILDLHSPTLLKMMQRRTGKALEAAGAPFRFGPWEGVDFFTPNGWTPMRAEGMLKTAARLGRLPLLLRVLSKLPNSNPMNPKRPWSAVCLFEKTSQRNPA